MAPRTHARRRLHPRLPATVALVAAVAMAPACTGAGQQSGTGGETGGEEVDRPEPAPLPGGGDTTEARPDEPTLTVRPDSGAPGSRVQLQAAGLPASHRIRLGAGPVNSEYEIIGETRSDGEGRVDATVSVPSWAEAGDRFVFVVETPDHETKVLSEPFPVTASGRTSPDPGSDDPAVEVVEVTGRLTDEGVECQALRSDGGRLYTLLGDLDGFQTGDRVRVEGQRAEMSFCMQGTTLTVVRIEGARGA